MKQKEVLKNIDEMRKKQEQAIMADNALYAKAMAEQAKQQNKHIQSYLGNHYDLQMINQDSKNQGEKLNSDEV